MSQAERPLPRRTFEVAVRGMVAEKLDLSMVEVGDYVELKNEPDNPVDINAVVVLTQEGHKLGYLPKDVAARMDPAEWDAVIRKVLHFEDEHRGLRLLIRPRQTEEEKFGT